MKSKKMKTKTINLSDQRMRLNKDQMKKIMASLEVDGDCQAQGSTCDTVMTLFCCHDMICESNACQIRT